MTEEENQPPVAAGAADGEKPVKKKTSVKVVRRVKSKKSEKGERPELAPPPATIEEQQPAAVAAEPASSTTATTTTTTKQQVDLSSGLAGPTTTTTTASRAPPSESKPAVERRVSSKRRAQRTGSNVFAMFTQNQIHQFKEAFGFIDQDKDGIISKSDIRATFDALGRLCSDKELAEMAAEAPGPINFTMFLSVFGDRIQGTDDESVVMDAFSRFDEGDGFCREEKLRNALCTWGEKFTKEECDIILREAPVDSRNRIDIKRFANLVTKGAEEEEEGA